MARPLSISQKILLGVVPVLLISITASVLLHNYFQEQDMVRQAQNSVETYAMIIRESLVSMMVKNYEVDESFLQRIQTLKEIDSLRIILNVLHLRADLVTEEREQRLELKRLAYGAPDSVDRQVIASGEPSFRRSGDHFRATVPFKATKVCQQCHQVPLDYPIGAADIHVSLSNISRSIEDNWTRSFTIFVLFLMIALGVGTYSFRSIVAHPVETLLKETRRISSGDMTHGVHVPERPDELGVLAGAFEEMRRSLAETLKELAEKNNTLEGSLKALREAQNELIRSERMSIIGQMASSIIHDFKNPMMIALSHADILKNRANLTPEQQTFSHDAIVRSVQRMSDMTRDLLDFSRGNVALKMEEVQVGTLVDDVREGVTLNLEKHKVDFEVKGEYHGAVRVDIEHFRRALINIINNAQEAMPKGGRLTMEVSKRNGFAEFKLTDTGVGIPDEIRDRIFEPFLTHGKSQGTGLGLAITKRIIDAHKGRIEVDSKVGVGTTFSVLIPL